MSGPRTHGDHLRLSRILSATTYNWSRSASPFTHPLVGTSMAAAWTLQGTRTSKLKLSLDPQIKSNIGCDVVEVKAEAFVRAFLYPSSRLGEHDPMMERDIDLASACHDMLKQGVSKNDALRSILTDPTCPKYSKTAFTLLDPDVKSEEDLYTPFRTLFTFINTFYRVSLANRPSPLDIDTAWPAAVDPKPGDQGDTRTLTEPIRRNFVDTRGMKLKFSPRLVGTGAYLKVDFVLMVHHNKDPNAKQPSVHWKDVRVPIEIKRTFKSEGEIVSHMGCYSRAMLMEQFDRKFALTVSLSATQCRLFRWDSVGCHTTEIIDIHDDPILFIRCIARLAMMTPAELGYDEHFSNAGRVLSNQKITTTLTVRASPIREYLDREPSPEEIPPETSASMLLELDMENVLSESTGEHLYQDTRVWRGKEILDVNTWKTGPTRVVKQTWAEDTRPSEGYFYKLTNDIPTICSLVLMEECDRTRAYHNRVTEHDEIGDLKATEKKPRGEANAQAEESLLNLGLNALQVANTLERHPRSPSSGRSLERVLLRLVFEEEYTPLSEASNPSELLDATVQWLEGLVALDRLGIVHRNISYSNLMLPATDQGSGPGKTAKIIDLSLAHWKDPQRRDGPPSRSLGISSGVPETPIDGRESVPEGSSTPDHHHVTGTLPFIALKLMRRLQLDGYPNADLVEHALHHDVESVFWVLVSLGLLKAQDYRRGIVTGWLKGLTNPKVGFVASTKADILGLGREYFTQFTGSLHELGNFIQAFADYYDTCRQDRQTIDPLKVLDIALEHRDKRAQNRKEDSTPKTVQQPPSMTLPHPLATVDSPKRKLSSLDDSSETGEGREVSEEEIGTPRKKTKLP